MIQKVKVYVFYKNSKIDPQLITKVTTEVNQPSKKSLFMTMDHLANGTIDLLLLCPLLVFYKTKLLMFQCRLMGCALWLVFLSFSACLFAHKDAIQVVRLKSRDMKNSSTVKCSTANNDDYVLDYTTDVPHIKRVTSSEIIRTFYLFNWLSEIRECSKAGTFPLSRFDRT